jgi:hypothetical protein
MEATSPLEKTSFQPKTFFLNEKHELKPMKPTMQAVREAREEAKEWIAQKKIEKDDVCFSKLLNKFRKLGWHVAVHNDYKKDNEWYTFWLFTKGNECVKGEGRTDLEALLLAKEEIKRIDIDIDRF